MRSMTLKHALTGAGAFVASSIIALWSWNTVAGLFEGPQAEFKHAIAALALLVLVRLAILPRRAHSRRT